MENISLYISLYNAEKTIEEVLDAIFNLEPGPNEVIIINDASNDKTLEILKKYEKKIRIFNLLENKGVGYCRNLAIKNASNNIIASLDADVVPDKKWLINIYNSMILYKSHLCGGLLIEKFIKKNRYNYWRSIHIAHSFKEKNIPDLKSFINGSNMIVDKKAWLKVEGFEEKFKKNGEDVHFCSKLRLNNFKISYDSRAYCYHLQNDDLKSLLNRCWRYYIYGTGLKKPTIKRLILRTIKHFRYCIINSAKDLINLRLSLIDINFIVFFNYIIMEYKSCKKGFVVF